MNDRFKQQVLEMREIDQDLRQNIAAQSDNKTANYLIYAIDYVNGQRLQDLVEKFRYPDEDMIGEDGMEAFWLLVQHQDYDVSFQKACLENCPFTDKQHAYLTDRVRVNEGRKQLYGTQFTQNESGKLVPEPIEKKEKLDRRREEVGLEPFSEYKEKMQE